jgi:tight adherence protein B
MGGDASQALREMRVGAHASELAFVAVALDVQHQSGGAMRQVLDAAAETVKSEIELRRTLRVQTAQARLSARIVVVMPFILIAAFSLASPDFLTPFFTSVFGYALLGVALVMQAAGVVLVRRALEVEGVS